MSAAPFASPPVAAYLDWRLAYAAGTSLYTIATAAGVPRALVRWAVLGVVPPVRTVQRVGRRVRERAP